MCPIFCFVDMLHSVQLDIFAFSKFDMFSPCSTRYDIRLVIYLAPDYRRISNLEDISNTKCISIAVSEYRWLSVISDSQPRILDIRGGNPRLFCALQL